MSKSPNEPVEKFNSGNLIESGCPPNFELNLQKDLKSLLLRILK